MTLKFKLKVDFKQSRTNNFFCSRNFTKKRKQKLPLWKTSKTKRKARGTGKNKTKFVFITYMVYENFS